MENTTVDPKQITKLFFERISASDLDGALSLLTEDATWQNAGKPELLRTARSYDVAGLRRLFERMFQNLEAGLKMSVRGMIAEGDQLAAEVESSGDLRNGRKYRQQYHFVLQFHAGKIRAVREYLDTLHVHDVWFRE